MTKRVDFGKAAHYFEGGNNSVTAEKTQEQAAEQAAKKARRIKIAKWTGFGVATVGVGIVTVRGIKKLIKGKKGQQEVPAPEEEQPQAKQQPANEQKPAEAKPQNK